MKAPAAIVSGWQRRLLALAKQPAYVFLNTPQDLIEQHYRQLTNFAGCPESAIVAAEARMQVQFPQVFRQYLLDMARARGELFSGSNLADLSEFETFRSDALELLTETDPALALPPEAVVFLFHQGYAFAYVLADGGFDGPVMHWTETELAPLQVAPTFADFVDAELRGMEENNLVSHNNGGYYLTLHPGGGCTQTYPALTSGDRPLGRLKSKRWWRFWRPSR